LDQVLNTLDPATRTALASFLTQLGGGVRGRAGDVAALVRQSESTLGSTAATFHSFDSPQLRDLLSTLTSDTGVLAGRINALSAELPNFPVWMKELASSTGQVDANGYFLRLLPVFGALTPSGIGGAEASQSRTASGSSAAPRAGGTAPQRGLPPVPSVLSGMLDLVYGG